MAKKLFLLIPQLCFTINECKIIYLTMFDSICLISMLAHNLSMKMHLLLPTVNRQLGMHQCFSYKSILPTLTQLILLKVNVYNIFTQYILVKRWGTYLYTKNIEASSFVSLHLAAFYIVRRIIDQTDRIGYC